MMGIRQWLYQTTGIYWRWQNLEDELPGGPRLGGLRHGRGWLRFWDQRRDDLTALVGLSWHFGAPFCHAYLAFDSGEREVMASVGVPRIVSLWLWVKPHRWRRCWPLKEGREVGIHYYEGYLRWHLWSNDDRYPSAFPAWREGSFNIPNFVFGKQKYSTEDIETRAVVIPMPEGGYPATARLFRSTWQRPRWPWPRRLLRVSITLDNDACIPFPGKGDNSWDLGDDGVYAQTARATSIEEAIGTLVADVLKIRRERGWTPDQTRSA